MKLLSTNFLPKLGQLSQLEFAVNPLQENHWGMVMLTSQTYKMV